MAAGVDGDAHALEGVPDVAADKVAADLVVEDLDEVEDAGGAGEVVADGGEAVVDLAKDGGTVEEMVAGALEGADAAVAGAEHIEAGFVTEGEIAGGGEEPGVLALVHDEGLLGAASKALEVGEPEAELVQDDAKGLLHEGEAALNEAAPEDAIANHDKSSKA
jgi:hypothetical protein